MRKSWMKHYYMNILLFSFVTDSSCEKYWFWKKKNARKSWSQFKTEKKNPYSYLVYRAAWVNTTIFIHNVKFLKRCPADSCLKLISVLKAENQAAAHISDTQACNFPLFTSPKALKVSRFILGLLCSLRSCAVQEGFPGLSPDHPVTPSGWAFPGWRSFPGWSSSSPLRNRLPWITLHCATNG